MKVSLHGTKKCFDEKQIDAVHKYVKLLQSSMPLKTPTTIIFADTRDVKMTTGVRRPGHNIHVLVHKRMFIDVLRTLAHEWAHEFEHQKLGMKDTKKVKDIGGPEENLANILAGIMTKRFQKKYPDLEGILYNED
jgi:hypothetical protein